MPVDTVADAFKVAAVKNLTYIFIMLLNDIHICVWINPKMASKKHKPLFVDDEPETSPTIPEPLHANPLLLEVKETKELTTNILGFGPRFGKPWTRANYENLKSSQLGKRTRRQKQRKIKSYRNTRRNGIL